MWEYYKQKSIKYTNKTVFKLSLMVIFNKNGRGRCGSKYDFPKDYYWKILVISRTIKGHGTNSLYLIILEKV